MIQILELFEGKKVEVSSDGRIFTLDNQNIRKNGKVDNRKGKELKPSIDKYGYKHVVLSLNGIRKTYTVHRLVAMAFIPNPFEKDTVNHIDGNKLNNSVENLEWATQREQKQHSIENGLCRKNIEALKKCNKIRSRKVIFKNKLYESINSAAKENKVHKRVIVKEGVFINGDSNS